MKEFKTENYDSDIEIVNSILRVLYGGERRELADRLIKRFGSFHAVFRASREDLIKVEGLTEAAAAFFSAEVPQFRQALRRAAKSIRPSSEYDLVNLALAMDDGVEEKFGLTVYIDGADRVVGCDKFFGERSVKKTVGTACGVDAAKLATIEYARKEKRAAPDVTSVKSLLETVKAIEAVGIVFVDNIEFIGHKFRSLRRAVSGDNEYTDIQDATKEKYRKMPNFSDLLYEYSKKRIKTARLEILHNPNEPNKT